MTSLAVTVLVVAIVVVALTLAAVVSRWIAGRGEEARREVGSGDNPGSRERGPGGMKM